MANIRRLFALIACLCLSVTLSASTPQQGGWRLIGRHPDLTTYSPGQSPSGTRVPTNSSSIVDAGGNVWTLSGSTILENGTNDNGGFGSQILWYQGFIYALGGDNNWYIFTSGWAFFGPTDPSTIAATAFYVATTGDDSRSCGTAMNIATPKQTVVSGLACLAAGTTLFVRGGTYNESVLNSQSQTQVVGGTSWANKVRIAAYPGETVWMRPTSGSISAVIWFVTDTSKYIELDGINIDASAMTDIAGLVTGGNDPATQMAHHIRIQNAEIIRATTSGGCLAGGCPETDGVLFGSHEIEGTIGSNEALSLNIHGGASAFGYGVYVSGPNNLIDGCNIHDTSSAGVQVYNGGGDSADNNIIRNNHIHDITTTGQDRGWGIIVAGDNNLIYNNVIDHLTFTFSSTSAGLYVYSGSGNLTANNTVTANSMPGVLVNGGVSSTIVKNNIAYLNTGGNYSDGGTSTTHDHNLEGINPTFVSTTDFHLQAGSLAINTGVTVVAVTTDIDGITRPQGAAYDIGAYEFH